MIKKYNQQKKAVILPDRTTGQRSSWGVIWNKTGFEFGLIPRNLPDVTNVNFDNAIAELSEFLQDSIKLVDRITEYYNITYMPGEQTHVQEIRIRDTRTTVSYSRIPLFPECWFVITEVDREFCVIENIVTGETKMEMKGRLFGVKPDEMSNLALHWTECVVISNDRLRLTLDLLRQAKKEDKLGDKADDTADTSSAAGANE